MTNDKKPISSRMKRINTNVAADLETISQFEAQFGKLQRQIQQQKLDVLDIKGEVSQIRIEMDHRLQAVMQKLELMGQSDRI